MLKNNEEIILEGFKKNFPDRINEKNEILVMKNGGYEEFIEYKSARQELALYSATFGQDLCKQKYPNTFVERVSNSGLKMDISLSNFEDEVFCIIENGMATSLTGDVVYTKIAQSLNYMYDLNNEKKLADSSIIIQVNFFDNKKLFTDEENYFKYTLEQSNKYQDVFKEYGIMSWVFVLDKKQVHKIINKMTGYIKKDSVISIYKEYFPLEIIQTNDYSYSSHFNILYLEDSIFTLNSAMKESETNFSLLSKVATDTKYESTITYKLPYRNNNRLSSVFDNTRGLQSERIEELKVDIYKTAINKISIGAPMEEMYENIGWENKKIQGSSRNSIVFKDGKQKRILIVSTDMVVNNGQHNSIAWYEILKEIIEDDIRFENRIKNIQQKADLDFIKKELTKYFTRAIMRVDFNFYKSEKIGILAGQINNNTKEQSRHDHQSLKHRTMSRMIVSEYNKKMLVLDEKRYMLDIGLSKREDPKFSAYHKATQVIDIANLNIFINSFNKGRSLSNISEKKEFHRHLDMLKINNQDFSKKELEDFTIFKYLLGESGKSLSFFNNFEGLSNYVLKDNLQTNVKRRNSLKGILSDIITEAKKESTEYSKQSYIFQKLNVILKASKSLTKNKRISHICGDMTYAIEDADIMAVKIETLEKYLDLLQLENIEVDIKKLMTLVEIYVILTKEIKSNELFTSNDSFISFIGLLVGYYNQNISIEQVVNFKEKLDNWKENIGVASIRNSNFNIIQGNQISTLLDLKRHIEGE